MAQNVTIAGAQYSDVPSISVPKTGGGGFASFVDTTDADASAADILSGKKAYVNGQLLTGTLVVQDRSFIITADFNLANFSVSNIQHGSSACTLSDAQAAIAAGKRPELRLSYTSPSNQQETTIGDLKVYKSTGLDFIALMVADLGGGNTVYLFRATWRSDGITVTPYVLSAT